MQRDPTRPIRDANLVAIASGVADHWAFGDITVTAALRVLLLNQSMLYSIDCAHAYLAALNGALGEDLLDDFVLVGGAELVLES